MPAAAFAWLQEVPFFGGTFAFQIFYPAGSVGDFGVLGGIGAEDDFFDDAVGEFRYGQLPCNPAGDECADILVAVPGVYAQFAEVGIQQVFELLKCIFELLLCIFGNL